MFRNLRLYRVIGPWPDNEEVLSEALANKAFRPCSAASERSAGWENPMPIEGDEGSGPLTRRLSGADQLVLRTQTRVLPPAAIKESLTERVADYRRRMGQEPPRRELRRLKEETRNELMPKALVQSSRCQGFVLAKERLLAVDAAAPARAEWFIEHLRTCLDGVRFEPLRYQRSPGTLMQEMFLGKPPAGFSLGRECRMADPSDGRSTGTWRHVDLNDETLRRHVRDGLKLTHLGFGFEEMLDAVLGEDGVISKLRLVEGDAADVSDEEDTLARRDAEFVLLVGIARRLLKRLEELLEGIDDSPSRAAGVEPAG
jgi:recombination associated protein RdgC